jgi:hypothetical protein
VIANVETKYKPSQVVFVRMLMSCNGWDALGVFQARVVEIEVRVTETQTKYVYGMAPVQGMGMVYVPECYVFATYDAAFAAKAGEYAK